MRNSEERLHQDSIRRIYKQVQKHSMQIKPAASVICADHLRGAVSSEMDRPPIFDLDGYSLLLSQGGDRGEVKP